jgi:hypothetical protein
MMIVQGGERIIDRNVYPERDHFFTELSRACAEEVADLSRASCRYLHLTIPFWHSCATTRSVPQWGATMKARKRWRACRLD